MTNSANSHSWRIGILLAVNIAVGVGLPFAIAWFTTVEVSIQDGAIIALLAVLVLTVGEMLFKIEDLLASRRGEIELWSDLQEVDNVVSSIRTGLHRILLIDDLRDSFYVGHYHRDLELLASRINDTVNSKEILIDRNHIDSTEVLLAIYDEKRHSDFRATHCLSDITEEFDITYRVYFNAWLKRLEARKVRRLRRLFVFDDAEQFLHSNTRKLVAFHNGGVKGLEAKAVSREDLHRFKSDFQIEASTDDIGIFSDGYLYLGRTRRDANISGVFSRDTALIETYRQMFDSLWSSTTTVPLGQFVSDVVDVHELFDPAFVLPKYTSIDDEEGGRAHG